MRKSTLSLLGVLSILVLTGCKPYQVPEFEIVNNDETAFVIDLDDSKDQAKFDSVEGLEAKKVASKRIPITKRWLKTGRDFPFTETNGEWIPEKRVIKVKRTAVTRSWVSENRSDPHGTGLWLESGDSIGFSTGFSCTANIEEADAALFLYKCKADTLESQMDNIIRARIQGVASQIASKYSMDELRSKKNEMLDAIKADLIPEMKKYGITVTNVSNFNGFTYENAAIQQSIDAVFTVQQEKATAKAKLDAVSDQNKAIKELAQGKAQAIMAEAEGAKAAAITKSQGEKEAAILASEGQASKLKAIAQGEKDAAVLAAEAANQSAILKAQADNQAVTLAAEAEAKRIKLTGEAEASNIKITGEAKASSVKAVAQAIGDSVQSSAYLESLRIDAQKTLYSKWSGAVPSWQMSGSGDGKNANQMMMIMPKLPEFITEKASSK